MMTDLLRKAYDPENFRKEGHVLVDLLTNYLTKAYQGQDMPVIKYQKPEMELEFWQNYQLKDQPAQQLFSDLLDHSIHLHHKNYMGHQVSPPLPATALTNMLSAILNNGMAVYEMGPAASALEKIVTKEFAKAVGHGEQADGFLTSGGTLANLTGLLSARKAKAATDVWVHGTKEKLAVMVSAEAHYCVDRAVRIMGMGEEGVIKIPVNERFQMRTDLLEKYYLEALEEGIKVIAVVGSACSTSTGSYDNLEAIAHFCKNHNLWFHVDGAHGGGAVFSSKYKHLLKGIEQADSVVIDVHKMLMAPALTTMLLFKDGTYSYETFSQKAQYLWEQAGEQEWYNMAKRTFECTKHMMSAKVFTMMQVYGTQLFEDNINLLYGLAESFTNMLKDKRNFEVATQPEANIICFRYLAEGLREDQLNVLNSRIRRTILEKGDYYIVQTLLNEQVYLRVTLMNPFTTEKELAGLLEEIEKQAVEQLSNNQL